MTYKTIFQQLLLACVTTIVGTHAIAGVVISGTRVIYPAAQKEVSVKLNNNGNLPALVQTWVDNGNVESTPADSKAPFLLSPPVFRIDPNKGQTLRMMFTGPALPEDKESVFWLNVLEIPPKAPAATEGTNVLSMAFRSRIKIFYRPTTLTGNASEAAQKLQWRAQPAPTGKGYELQASNPSAFHVSLVGLTLIDGGKRYSGADGMVPPKSNMQFALPELRALPSATAMLEFNSIDDYGALNPQNYPLRP